MYGVINGTALGLGLKMFNDTFLNKLTTKLLLPIDFATFLTLAAILDSFYATRNTGMKTISR